MIEDKPITGVAVDRRSHPAGREGAILSLHEVGERAWKARMSPRLRAWVTQELAKAGVSTGTRRQKAQAVLDAYRAKVPYVADPVMGEFIATPEQTLCLDDGGLCIVGGDCFPEGTLLLRDDHEFVPIEQIKEGDRIWGRDKWSEVTQKWAKGDLPVDAVEMSNGSTMHLTADHHVYVGACAHGPRCEQVQCKDPYKRVVSFDRRVRVSDLREGDTLLQPTRIAFGTNEVDPDRMYVEALALSDGWTLKALETIHLTEVGAEAALRGLMADSTKNTTVSTRTYSTTSRKMMIQVRVLHRMFGKMTGVKMLTPEQHGGAGRHPLWRVGQREKDKLNLFVRTIERAVRKVPCWDIETDDHYVYLPEHDVTVSNCDDASTTLIAAMLCIGIPAMVIGSSHKPPYDVPTHVFMAFEDEQGEWVRIDGTTRHPVGRVAPHHREWWVEPGQEAKDRGEGDFVGMAGANESRTRANASASSLASVLDLLYPSIK
jgi:hypothetical protein